MYRVCWDLKIDYKWKKEHHHGNKNSKEGKAKGWGILMHSCLCDQGRIYSALLTIHKEVEWLCPVVWLHYEKQKHKGENSRVFIQLMAGRDGGRVIQGAHRWLGGH
jgi:hypothetical protein